MGAHGGLGQAEVVDQVAHPVLASDQVPQDGQTGRIGERGEEDRVGVRKASFRGGFGHGNLIRHKSIISAESDEWEGV